ncbi:MAG TPA: peptide chain release factor 1, partial [bacterium]
MNDLLRQAEKIISRYEDITQKLADPFIIANPQEYASLARERASLENIVQVYRDYKRIKAEISGNNTLLKDEDKEIRDLAKSEIEKLEKQTEELNKRLKILLLPNDPLDKKGVIVEIRAGAGGDEAALFAGALYRMYTRYAERHGWKTELMDSHSTGIGGFKEVIFSIEGEGAYSRFKYESGVHRVQRVPKTEASGRIHTSTSTVAVLPEAQEVDVQIRDEDLKIDTFRAGGRGGQNVNKVETAVRITHISTGLVVVCQDERSQYKNKTKALKVLRSRLLKQAEDQKHNEISMKRKSQV